MIGSMIEEPKQAPISYPNYDTRVVPNMWGTANTPPTNLPPPSLLNSSHTICTESLIRHPTFDIVLWSLLNTTHLSMIFVISSLSFVLFVEPNAFQHEECRTLS